jgi:transcriptional regulator with XRE-family HTH domain
MAGKQNRDVGAIIADNIRKLRKDRRLSQTELEVRSGVSQTMVSAIERNITSAAADTLEALAKALNVAVWQLQVDGLADDLILSNTLPDLVYAYRDLPKEDRAAIDALIARLARTP